MSRKCTLNSCKAVLSGHKVSHSNRKTKTKFLPNLQNFSLASEALGRVVRLRATPNSIRSVEHNDGLDNYLLNTSSCQLSPEAKKLKRQIKVAIAQKAAAN
ncbi:MAG: 50S ribosomal protein L28 [Proteobacteria bacterium]|nr:50S ribosomal protein L28 [Pseudomonadota bacterium]